MGQSMYKNLPREHRFEPLRVEGTLPSELEGTLYRQGPGLFELFGVKYQHVFEADGAVTAVRLKGGCAWGACRIIESEGLQKERQQGRALYGFGVPWWRRYLANRKANKNTANTNIVSWQGRLFGLMEASKPTEISTEDLSTLGETDLDGVILGGFSAHPHEVPSRQALYNFGLRYGRDTFLDVYELPYVGPPHLLTSIALPFAPMLHDFMVTDKHILFFLSPAKLKVPRALFSIGPWSKLFQWDSSEATEVFVVPMDDPEKVVRFSTDPFYQWHFSNAFERGGEIVVDLIRYPDFSTFDALGDGSNFGVGRTAANWGAFHRGRIDLSAKTFQSEEVCGVPSEFPRIHPDYVTRPYRYAWMATEPTREEVGRVPHKILKLDVTSGQVDSHDLSGNQYPSEPVFVPRKDSKQEDDGFVLSLIYDPASHTSFLGVFDGVRINDGPVARVWFDHHIPVTFHGNWVPSA